MEKNVKLFYMNGCPYCAQAFRALEDLKKEDPAYGTIDIHMYEEYKDANVVAKYDFYYNPSIFVDEKKVYEAHPGENYAECRKALKKVLNLVLDKS